MNIKIKKDNKNKLNEFRPHITFIANKWYIFRIPIFFFGFQLNVNSSKYFFNDIDLLKYYNRFGILVDVFT